MVFGKLDMKGFSLIQLILIGAIISAVIALINFAPNPRLVIGRQRDAVRISDLSTLVVIAESYTSDFGTPPGAPNVVRFSNIPTVSDFLVNDATGRGWIGADLGPYIRKLPKDPVNSSEFVYRYKHNGTKFKFDAKLEAETNLMENSVDGGIDNDHFEAGSGKEIVME